MMPASSVLAEFLGVLEWLDLGVKAVYLDREFYDGKCLTLLQAHNYAYVTPVVKWGEAIQAELSQGWSRTIEHDLITEFDGHSWTVEFPVSKFGEWSTRKPPSINSWIAWADAR